jgi:GT2 family glycosyltransferase
VLRVLCGEIGLVNAVTTVSIIIVSYNARADLERCLASLHEHPPAVPHEIIVVDNASADGSADAARAWPRVRVIGIRASSGENLLLLNSDTIVPAGAIDGMLQVLERHPDVAVVGPRLVDASGRAELSFGRMISPFSELRQKRLVVGNARGETSTTRQVEEMTRREQSPDWVSGAALIVRRRDAEAVGLLDERYFMYTEDVDFCAAIRARGRRILFTPSVEIVHLRGRSAAAAPAATQAAYRRSQLAFYEKHHPLIAPLLRLYLKVRGVAI